MKIGYIASSLSSGDGWSRYAQGLSGAVAKLDGITTKIITSADSEVEGDNIYKVLPSHLTFRPLDQLKVFYYCLKYLNDCDLIHILFEKPMLGAAFASRLIGTRYVMTLHGTYAVPPSGHGFRAVIKRWLMKKAHSIAQINTTGSFNTEARVRAVLPNIKEVRFIPNGVDGSIFHTRPEIKNEGFMLGVGGIKERKGFDIVIKALGLIKDEFPDLKYKIIGGDNDKETDHYYQYLVQLIKENGLENRVQIRVGKISRIDLAKEYNKCGLFILTSRDSATGFEGFPLVYFEAQACGAPVIATKGFGSEYAVKENAGTLVESENVEATAKAIKKIIGDSKLRKSMSQNAVNFAQEHTWDKIAEKYLLKFYQDALIRVPFLKLDTTDKDIASMVKVLKSGWLVLANEGRRFEQNFTRFLGTEEAVLTNSCTNSIHLSLLAAGIGPGDEVITTPLTYVSTVNPIIFCGAKPVFVDVEPETGLIDVAKIEQTITPKTKAILPVHLYGQMADMKAISTIAKKHDLIVIEDAAHAIEAERDGIRPGQKSFSACFSFHVAKNITSGEGGALVTNDKKIAEQVRLLRRDGVRNIGIKRRMEVLGYKYLTTDFQAALLNSQLERVQNRLETRKKIYQNYYESFKDIPGLNFPKIVSNSQHAYHMFVVWVSPEFRDKMLRMFSFKGIEASVHYEPVHLEPYYRQTFGFKEGDFPVAEKLGASVITLPLHLKLTPEEQKYVIKQAIRILRRQEI